VAQDWPHSIDDDRRVVRFRPRRGSLGGKNSRDRAAGPSIRDSEANSVVPDLAKYEGSEDEDDDYWHRMLMNAIGLTVNASLIIAGVWLLGNARGD
jgi:hypothetical protein